MADRNKRGTVTRAKDKSDQEMRQGQAMPVRKKVQRLEERMKSESVRSSKRKKGMGGQQRFGKCHFIIRFF